MNDYFNKTKNLFILTPFKYIMCNLINQIIRNNDIDISFKVKIFDILRNFFNDYSSELSYSHFINKLKKYSKDLCLREKNNLARNPIRPDKDKLHELEVFTKQSCEYLLDLLTTFRSNGIEDIYMFFHLYIKELKFKEESTSFLDNGGIIDHYIRKCLIAFYKLSFEDFAKLYEAIENYLKDEEIKIELSNHESEQLFEKHVQITRNNTSNNNEFELIIDKVKNYKQKYYFFSKYKTLNETNSQSSHIIQELNKNSRKYFDYNMKYYYSETIGDNRTHYALLISAEEYYKRNHYEESVDLLTECIKLVQSNCDHEGLVKCFIWLYKIFRNLGQYESAKKFLTSSIIKSYENNYHLLYMIASMELSSLNLTFGSNLGLSDISNMNYENNCLYNCSRFLTNLKRILQFNMNKKADYHIFSNFDEYMSIYYINVINYLLLAGHISLAKNYISNLFTWIKNYLNKENMNYLLHILFEIAEFDFKYVIDILIEMIQNKQFLILLKDSSLVNLISLKFSVYSGNHNLIELVIKRFNDSSFDSFNCYFNLYITLLKLIGKTNKFIQNDLVNELYQFKKLCKKLDFNKFTLETYLLISQVLINQERYTEALIYVNKAKVKSKALNLKTIHTKSKYYQSKILFLSKDYDKFMKIVRKYQSNIEKNADVKLKAEFYLLQANFLIIENKSDISRHIIQIIRLIIKSIENYSICACQTNIDECFNLLYIVTILSKNFNNDYSLQNRYSKAKQIKELSENRIKILNSYMYTFETTPEKKLISLRMIIEELDKFVENIRIIFNFKSD